MTTRAINEELGMNGAYLQGGLPGGDTDNPRVTRARKSKGTLQFKTLFHGWVTAPDGWVLVSGSTGRCCAKAAW